MATQQQNKTPSKGNMTAGIPAQQLQAQQRYWREHFRDEPYYMQGKEFDAYEPAYRLGIEARNEHPGKQFPEVEDKLRAEAASLGADAVVVVVDRLQPVGAFVSGPWFGRDVDVIKGRKVVGVAIKYRS